MEPLFLSFASQLRVNVPSRPSSRLATAETLRPRRCPYALCDSLFRQNTLHVSFNPRCLLVHLTFHIFREDAQAARVGFVIRLSGLVSLFRLSRSAPDGPERRGDNETDQNTSSPFTFYVSRFTVQELSAVRNSELGIQNSTLVSRFTPHASRLLTASSRPRQSAPPEAVDYLPLPTVTVGATLTGHRYPFSA
jgi:hypothetical protein